MNQGRVFNALSLCINSEIYMIIFQLNIKVMHVNHLPFNQNGLLVNMKYVFLLEELSLYDKTFYLLHELGHAIMHSNFADKLHTNGFGLSRRRG